MKPVKKKFIEDNAIDGSKFELLNGQSLRAKKADGTDATLLSFNSSNELRFSLVPKLGAVSPASSDDLINKGYVDQQISLVNSAVALKQDSLGTGTTSQFLRGDLTWSPLKYVAALSWSGAGPYTMSIPAATHGKGSDPCIVVREQDGSDLVDMVTMEVRINASGDITLNSAEMISGKVIVS